MKRTAHALAIALLLLTRTAAAQSQPRQAVLSDADIRKILVERIDNQKQGVGIVVGVIEPAGRRVVAYGAFDANDKRPLNGDTLFEIGSATKVFTSLLLADMVQRGEVALDDPVAKYLPAEATMPRRGEREITLIDLATHTSALPRMPSNLNPKDPSNPYADYTVTQLYDFLRSYELQRDIGAKYDYSNLGAGLLGHALSRRAGSDYETLVRTRILEPLRMKSTAITLSDAMKSRLAVGHNGELKAVPNWDLPTLAGAGAIRSTANDLLTFLAANLGWVKSPLSAAMTSMLATRRPTGTPALEIALAWHVSSAHDREIVWHNGGTGGYRSFIGFDPKSRVGVVVLSNTFTNAGIDDIGKHLLDPAVPLIEPAKERKAIVIDPKVFDGIAGRYALSPEFILTVTREDNHLFVQATGQPKFEAFPESAREYFLKVVDAQLTFETNDAGRGTTLVLHQNGANLRAKRIEGEPAPPRTHKQIKLSTEVLDRYVGRYALAPNFIITVTREDDHLFAQATNQPKIEIFAESEREFFYNVVDAQITFEVGPDSRATSLILHQNGMNPSGKRVE